MSDTVYVLMWDGDYMGTYRKLHFAFQVISAYRENFPENQKRPFKRVNECTWMMFTGKNYVTIERDAVRGSWKDCE